MTIDLNDYPLWSIFLVSFICILGASEIGRRLGVRASKRGGDNVSTLEGAILGLLALMIGFTFAMALARFESRRDAVLNEANAIGTTALRARLLPAPHRAQALKLLQEYAQVRLDITRRIPSPAEVNAAISRSNALLEALWQQAKAVALKDNGMVPTGLFIQSPNEMIVGAQTVLLGSKAARANPWIKGLLARCARLKVAVALPNKIARIAWAVMAKGEPYRQIATA